MPRTISIEPSPTANILGAEHPDTLNSRNNLAGAYHHAGDLTRAISIYEMVLADCERILGAENRHTEVVRKNLAAAWKDYESGGFAG